MSDWKQKIEAQIAWLNKQPAFSGHKPIADTMQALLDVAVAAERLPVDGFDYHPRSFMQKLVEALDKLREVGDD